MLSNASFLLKNYIPHLILSPANLRNLLSVQTIEKYPFLALQRGFNQLTKTSTLVSPTHAHVHTTQTRNVIFDVIFNVIRAARFPAGMVHLHKPAAEGADGARGQAACPVQGEAEAGRLGIREDERQGVLPKVAGLFVVGKSGAEKGGQGEAGKFGEVRWNLASHEAV